jgi:hypothetical protein
MKAFIRMLVGTGAALFVLVFTIPGAALAHGCPETELARVVCPQRPGYYTYVCQDHHGIVTVHSHCIPPE